jgi:hypothetical protein
MNAKVQKTIHGRAVVAQPVFKGEPTPAYWLGTINEHALEQRFPSAPKVFDFVARLNTQTRQY